MAGFLEVPIVNRRVVGVPGLAVYGLKQRLDFRARQEPDQRALAAFIGCGQHPLDHAALFGDFQGHEPKE